MPQSQYSIKTLPSKLISSLSLASFRAICVIITSTLKQTHALGVGVVVGVGVFVEVCVGVCVGVCVEVLVGVSVGVLVWVGVIVGVGVWVWVGVGVGVGQGFDAKQVGQSIINEV